MLKIESIYIKRTEEKIRLCADICWNNRCRNIWFEVDPEYEPYLCKERADGFLIALLPFAMINNHNIEVNGFVSERLLYQVKNVLLPALTSNISEFHLIDIKAKTDYTVFESCNAVGTAISCGVDSFYTVLKHINNDNKNYNLSHLTFFNIMNHPDWKIYGEDSSRDFYNARVNYVRPVAETLGLKLVAVDTNFDLLYHDINLLSTFPFRYFGVVLALQKLFKIYYWSSSHPISEFNFDISDVSFFDLLSIQCVSNENTIFYSAGSEATRLEKTKYISDFDITHKYLNVCWKRLHNCTSGCEKCRRTMLSLYVSNKLSNYSDVFDLEYFNKHLDEYLGEMLFYCTTAEGKKWYNEILNSYLENDLEITEEARVYARRLKLNHYVQRMQSIIYNALTI